MMIRVTIKKMFFFFNILTSDITLLGIAKSININVNESMKMKNLTRMKNLI